MILATQSPSVNRIPFRFRAIPSEILARPDLGSTAKLLFAVLADAARTTGLCRLTNAMLAGAIGRSESEVYRTLLELERAGLIRRVHRGAARNVRVGLEVTWASDQPSVAAAPTLPAPIADAPRGQRPGPAKTEAVALPSAPRERGPSVDLGNETTGETPTTLISSLPGKPQAAEAVADRLIVLFKDDIAFRSKYIRLLRRVAGGEIAVERGVYAAKEAAKRSRAKGLAFLAILESTTPIPGEAAKPDADSPDVAVLLTQGRSADERERSIAIGSLIAKGFTLDEIRGLFSAHVPTASPVPPPPSSPPSPGDYLRGLVRQHKRQGS